MNGLSLVGVIIVGGLAGWIATLLMRRADYLLANIAIGVVGSFVGAFAANLLGIAILPGFASCLLVATLGAVFVLGLFGLFRHRA